MCAIISRYPCKGCCATATTAANNLLRQQQIESVSQHFSLIQAVKRLPCSRNNDVKRLDLEIIEIQTSEPVRTSIRTVG